MSAWTQDDVNRHNAKLGAKMPAHVRALVPPDYRPEALAPPDYRPEIAAIQQKLGKQSRSKYGNKKTLCGGIMFDSGHEADRYALLNARQGLGEIRDLELQPKYGIFGCELSTGRGIEVASFKADFRYFDIAENRTRIEDAKSDTTKGETAYRLRKKLVEVCHGIVVEEV